MNEINEMEQKGAKRERPVLFSGPMVRAILEGRKTQTRRVVKSLVYGPDEQAPIYMAGDVPLAFPERFYDGSIKCPYGRVGDRLWVKETWATAAVFDKLKPLDIPEGSPIGYAADDDFYAPFQGRTRPSIFMRQWMSRITLEIVSVRVERLQKISREDAKAEGFWPSPYNGLESWAGRSYGNAELAYRACWESINGSGSWAKNPWVWVIGFRRVQT